MYTNEKFRIQFSEAAIIMKCAVSLCLKKYSLIVSNHETHPASTGHFMKSFKFIKTYHFFLRLFLIVNCLLSENKTYTERDK